MSAGARGLRNTARTLAGEYAGLLRPDPSFHHPDADRAVDALEAARARVCGDAHTDDQLTLDVRQ